jgi:hypothetical protein
MKATKKSNKKKGQKKKAPSGGSNTSAMMKHVHLGMCTADYARSLANASTGPLACVPTTPAQLSKKFRVWAKGTFNAGTTGMAGIVLDPLRAVTNDSVCVFSTTSAHSTSILDYIVGAGWNADASNSEYTTAQLGPAENQFEARVVSAELKLRYIDTELNRGGQAVLFHDPNHMPLYGQSLANLDAEEMSKRFPLTREWLRVVYRPVSSTDLNFQTALPAYTPAATDLDQFYMGAIIQAAATTNVAFEYEVYVTFEVFGQNIRAMTPSHVDLAGLGAVHAVSNLGKNLYPTSEPGLSVEKKMVADTAKYLAHQSSHVSSMDSSTANKIAQNVKHAGDIVTATVSTGNAIYDAVSGVLDFLFF